MPDITELLEAAARRPGTGPDLAGVARRAVVLRRQQLAWRASVGLAAVAIALPAVLTGQGPQALDVDEVPASSGPTTTATPPTLPDSSDGPTRLPGPGAPDSGTRTAATAAAPIAASERPARATSASRPSLPPSLPPSAQPSPRPTTGAPAAAESCTVSTTTLGPGQEASCSFTAMRPGGWSLTRGLGAFSGDYVIDFTVVVRRAGHAPQTWSSAGDTECASSVVEPGDVVELWIREYDSGESQHDLGAGRDYGC